MGQIKPDKQNDTFPKLVTYVNMNETGGIPLDDEDIETGYQLFHAIVYCPAVDNIGLFRFVDQLLSSESSRTIIKAIVNLFHSGSIEDLKSYTQATQFYSVFAKTLRLQYGNILVGTSTKSQLTAAIEKGLPFLPPAGSPEETQGIFQELGIFY